LNKKTPLDVNEDLIQYNHDDNVATSLQWPHIPLDFHLTFGHLDFMLFGIIRKLILEEGNFNIPNPLIVT